MAPPASPIPEAAPDEALLERARSGDRQAFRALVERYEPVVAATVIGMLGRGQAAEDVGQQTFIRFYRALDQFRGDASLRTYLTRIAINLSLNEIKRRRRRQARFLSREVLPDTWEPPVEGGDPVEDRERDAHVRRAIQALPEKFRAVVVLRLMQGYSTRETAQVLDVPLGTVLSRLSRAQDRLRDLLEPYVRDRNQ